jgi:hypothetical protein
VSTQRKYDDYTYFRLVRRSERVCAVRTGDAFPTALRSGDWVQCILSPEEGDWLPGFDPHVAEFACSFQGFYLFNLGARTTQASDIAADSAVQPALRLSQN